MPDINLLLQVAGIGMLVVVLSQVLHKAGKEEYANLVSLTGMVLVLALLILRLGELIDTVKAVFGL